MAYRVFTCYGVRHRVYSSFLGSEKVKMRQIILDFGLFKLDADLFDSAVAQKFAENLPCTISLQQWGDELYGSIGINLGEENPLAKIPPGGIAFTANGNYLCIFFGQTPAWPVEYIGQITGEGWQSLLQNPSPKTVAIRLKDPGI